MTEQNISENQSMVHYKIIYLFLLPDSKSRMTAVINRTELWQSGTQLSLQQYGPSMVVVGQLFITSAQGFANWRSSGQRCRHVLEHERKCNAKRCGWWKKTQMWMVVKKEKLYKVMSSVDLSVSISLDDMVSDTFQKCPTLFSRTALIERITSHHFAIPDVLQ